jgi:hypothetical protein
VSNNIHPYFGVEVHSGGYIPHRWLFEDRVKEILDRANFAGSHIYYLARIKKLRFIPESALITSTQLSVDILVGSSHRTSVSIKLGSLPPLSTSGLDDFSFLSPSIDPTATTNLAISITINLGSEIYSIPIPIENLIAADNLDFSNPPEILYIGQSFDMLERWQNHKQVNRALALLSDDEDLCLYFIHFKFFASIDKQENIKDHSLLDVTDRNKSSFRDRISVLEQALIQFYCPALNSKHVRGNSATAEYSRVAATTGIKAVGLSLGMYGPAFQFWTPDQRLKDEVITLVYEDGVPTFHKGLMLGNFLSKRSLPRTVA